MTPRPPSRRDVLRGAGTALALPWLGSLAPRVARADATPPVRLAFVFVPNGVHGPDWTPPTEGTAFPLPPTLAPLEGVRDDVLVLSGLAHAKARANGDGPGDHARSSATFLTGAQARKTAGADLHVGVSVDQVAARAIGARTRFPSLELGTEPARQSGNCDSGYSCAYSSSIAWQTPRTPLGKEVHPRLAFERLVSFGAPNESAKAREERRLTRRSVLDWVREDARRLEPGLARRDREKLDEYVTAVRELERRIGRAEDDADRLPDGVSPDAFPAPVPRDVREHVRLMADLIVLAFRADLTRVVTFMVANEGSNRSHPFLGVTGGHHEISHHGGDPAKVAGIAAINRWHVEHLARLLQALRAVEEDGRPLLDRCLVLYGSGISDGDRHDHHDLPILLAGRGAGTVTPGRHVRHPTGTPLANLFVSLLERVGAPVASFGDSTGPLGGLTA
jgi:hypothetical protein